jgi:membrane protein YqaA with SNARE-associated domain
VRKPLDLLHRIKDRVEGFARKRNALWALFAIAFIESSVFPIPPDVLLIALGIANPGKSFLYAAVCSAGSVCGALLGYSIGYAFYETVGFPVLQFCGLADQFHLVLDVYRENAGLAIFVAGFTPIPFSVFTIAAGFRGTIDLSTFFLALIVGRGARFLLVGGALFVFGPKVNDYADRYLGRVTLALSILFVGGILLMRWIL